MAKQPPSAPEGDETLIRALALAGARIRSPWNRQIWKLYNFYTKFFRDQRFRNSIAVGTRQVL